MDKKALWLRLKRYEFDDLVPPTLWPRVLEAFGGADAATKAFADKLARKLTWSTPFALRAIAEYRKFVYLGMVSDFPVTPSKAIDQVWHEHQLFTRAYRRFCREILGRYFDHHPELIPTDEQLAHYQAQYRLTLALYRTEFNQDPPPDIWLVPKFQEAKVVASARPPRAAASGRDASASDDAPLYTYFGSDAGVESDAGEHHSGFDGFDGGHSGGGGGGASWSDSSGADTSGSDGGASSCSGSSCSSGCSSGN